TSRRRHTRSKRDWSSDVCYSDLVQAKKSPRITQGKRSKSRTMAICIPKVVRAERLQIENSKADGGEEKDRNRSGWHVENQKGNEIGRASRREGEETRRRDRAGER